MASRARSLPALTGIRPFASLLVFGFHFCRPVVASGSAWLCSLVSSGFVAVSFFFVLSGFILAVSHRQRLDDGTLDGKRFLLRRIGRIYPSYLFALVLMLPLALVPRWGADTGAFAGSSLLRTVASGALQLSMLHAWWPPWTLSWNLPAWSVSVELGCYLAFLLVARRLARLAHRQRWLVTLTLWLLALASAMGYSRFHPEAALAGPDASLPLLNVLKLWPPSRVPEFLFGVGVGLAWTERPRAPGWLGPLALMVIVLVLTHASSVPYLVLHNALLLPAFGALLYALASARGVVATLLGSRAFVAAGKSTYCIYILQMPLMDWLLLCTNRLGISLGGVRFVVVFAPIVVVASIAVHLTVERRGRRLLERWLERGAPVRAMPVEATLVEAKRAA